jgi:hypothetical protein
MSHPKSALTTQAIGLIGVSLYGCIFLLSVERIYAHFIPYRPPWYSTRKLFHILVCVYGALQSYSYIDYAMGQDHMTKSCYACHLLGIFAEICAFSLVAVLWSKYLLSKNNAKRIIVPLLLVTDGAFLVYIVYLIYDMMTTEEGFQHWLTSGLYLTLLVVEPVLLLVNGGCIIYLGLSIYAKLTNHPAWQGMLPQEKDDVVLRLWVTMVVCFFGFSLRATMELYLYFFLADGISIDLWWVLSTWLPTLGPASVLLYALRKTDRTNNKRYLQGYNDDKVRDGGRGSQALSTGSSTHGGRPSSWFRNMLGGRRPTDHGHSLVGGDDLDSDLGDPRDYEGGQSPRPDDTGLDHAFNLLDGCTGADLADDDDMLGEPSAPLLDGRQEEAMGRDAPHLEPPETIDFYQGAPNNNGLYRYKSQQSYT